MNLNIPSTSGPRIVIIGGGFGGLSFIKNFRLPNAEYQLVLIDQNNFHTFQPLLYQVATGGLEVGSIAFPLRRFLKNYKNSLYRMAKVMSVDGDKKLINTNLGELSYDYLVIANGSIPNFFGNAELEKNAMVLKTIQHSIDMRSLILRNLEEATNTNNIEKRQSFMTFVFAGGGPTGVEMAGALIELKKHIFNKDYPELDINLMQIYIVEASDRLLSSMSQISSDKTLFFLKKMGVNILLNTRLIGYDGEEILLENAPSIFSKNLVWTAGVKGNVPDGIAKESIARGYRIQVNEFNQLSNFENMFVIGDVAMCCCEAYPNGYPMVAPVAIQQGEHLAKNMIRVLQKQSLVPFHYRDKGSMATISKNKAVVELHRFKFQGVFAWFVWTFVHLMSIVGFRNRVIVLIDWVWNYFSYDRALRIITGSKENNKAI